MAITMLGEVTLNIQLDAAVTYGAIETAVLDAGFTDYSIIRLPGTGTTDVQVSVRSTPVDGVYPPMNAEQTLNSLAEVVADLA